MNNDVRIEIGDFLGFCDLNGVEALDSNKIEKLESLIENCNDAVNKGEELVVDAIYARLMEILKRVYPESELLKYIWEEADNEPLAEDDSDKLFSIYPMYSICTCKSYSCDELTEFLKHLPSGRALDFHVSIKLNGHGIRIVYKRGKFFKARSRARTSGGRDLSRQLNIILGRDNLLDIPMLHDIEWCEIRGELVLPFVNLSKAREYNSELKSAFTAVASMSRDSATEEEIELLNFVAYKTYFTSDLTFDKKEDEYVFLEDMGFEVPLSWVIPNLSNESLLDDLPSIVTDCEDVVRPSDNGENGYTYYSDGLVFEVNDREIFNSLGGDGTKYMYGNVALKVGYWQQDFYTGIVQTILWTRGKSKLSPVALVAEDPNVIEYKDFGDHPYILDISEVENSKDLGVLTAGGNRVKRVPLYEPNNMLLLGAFAGEILNFRYGGESGVVPCFPDGTPLVDGKIAQMMSTTDEEDEYTYSEEDIL